MTGAISDAVVIDLDSAEAKEKIKALVPDYDLAAVPRVRTGRGGIIFSSNTLGAMFKLAPAFYLRQMFVAMAAML